MNYFSSSDTHSTTNTKKYRNQFQTVQVDRKDKQGVWTVHEWSCAEKSNDSDL